MDWTKFLSREFLIGALLIVIATVALFVGFAGFVEWAAACGGFTAIWAGVKTYREVRANETVPVAKPLP